LRRHSVQQQNLETRERILIVAREFRRDLSRFPGLIDTLHAHSLDPADGILVDWHDVYEQDGIEYKGCWLTRQREFFRFEVLVPYDRAEPPVIEMWKEVTDETVVSAHLPGTGKSFGWLALDVLDNELA
jgi:hypothetical protein